MPNSTTRWQNEKLTKVTQKRVCSQKKSLNSMPICHLYIDENSGSAETRITGKKIGKWEMADHG